MCVTQRVYHMHARPSRPSHSYTSVTSIHVYHMHTRPSHSYTSVAFIHVIYMYRGHVNTSVAFALTSVVSAVPVVVSLGVLLQRCIYYIL